MRTIYPVKKHTVNLRLRVSFIRGTITGSGIIQDETLKYVLTITFS